VIVGSLQSAIVEAKGLARAVLKIKLAVVMIGKMLGHETTGTVRVETAV
jgi:hypothetical protein